MLTIHVDTACRSSTSRLMAPEDSRAARAMYLSQLARLLDLYDPFQHAGNLAPLASW